MRRTLSAIGLAALVTVAAPQPSDAQQSVTVYLGGFSPRGLDSRADGDVLLNNLFRGEYSLIYDFDAFDSFTFGGEWLVALGQYLEAGVGLGYYRDTVPSEYAYLVDDDLRPIFQELTLRLTPLAATVRVLPFGRNAAVQPYLGGGVCICFWRYSEVGEFVGTDAFGDFVFQDRFTATGAAVGPIALGGLRFPMGPWDLGGELRYHWAEGDLPEDQFIDPVIDLSGASFLLTFNIRF
jgi:hypothetical protein